jgi:hypothetical protein
MQIGWHQMQNPVIVQLAPSGAPWWAIPLVGGIFALLGVGAAQTITLRLDRRRRQREDERRLDSVLREVATQYLDATQSYATFVTTLAVGEVLIDTTSGPVEINSWFWRYSAETRAVTDAIGALELVAPKVILDFAERAEPLMNDFNLRVQDVPITERLKYSHADAIYNLQGPFRNQVRKHFGLMPLPEPAAKLAEST